LRWGSNTADFVGVAVVGGKNEALFLDGCPMFAQAYMGRKRRGAAPFNAVVMSLKDSAKSKIHFRWSESIGRIRFRPMYSWANMGHPSRTDGYAQDALLGLACAIEKSREPALSLPNGNE
jgi:hypothetical protein